MHRFRYTLGKVEGNKHFFEIEVEGCFKFRAQVTPVDCRYLPLEGEEYMPVIPIDWYKSDREMFQLGNILCGFVAGLEGRNSHETWM